MSTDNRTEMAQLKRTLGWDNEQIALYLSTILRTVPLSPYTVRSWLADPARKYARDSCPDWAVKALRRHASLGFSARFNKPE
jgi:SRSO17 transposase